MKATERSSCINYEVRRKDNTLLANLRRLIEVKNSPDMCKGHIGQKKLDIEVVDQDCYGGALVPEKVEQWVVEQRPVKTAIRNRKRTSLHGISLRKCKGTVAEP